MVLCKSMHRAIDRVYAHASDNRPRSWRLGLAGGRRNRAADFAGWKNLNSVGEEIWRFFFQNSVFRDFPRFSRFSKNFSVFFSRFFWFFRRWPDFRFQIPTTSLGDGPPLRIRGWLPGGYKPFRTRLTPNYTWSLLLVSG